MAITEMRRRESCREREVLAVRTAELTPSPRNFQF
jgi:hypothetical protein